MKWAALRFRVRVCVCARVQKEYVCANASVCDSLPPAGRQSSASRQAWRTLLTVRNGVSPF